MPKPYRILASKRDGEPLLDEAIHEVASAAADGSWSDAQLGAFLMAVAIRGLDRRETATLTRAMLESGESWGLSELVPGLVDKHSTGGVGDKVSLILGPLLAACGVPVVMLTGRGLGHTGGTADKLEVVPGLDLALTRARTLKLLDSTALAIGMATESIAPADRKLYALRDVTGTVESIPLITASILSKKLATGAAAITFDVKTGSGAFLPDPQDGRVLAALLVETAEAVGIHASALLTDMSQPLGRWSGHSVELRESLETLEGRGPQDLTELTLRLSAEAARLAGHAEVERERLQRALEDGSAREHFDRWALAQGASADWLQKPQFSVAPQAVSAEAPRAGVVSAVATRQLGFLLAEVGGGRRVPEDSIDPEVALETLVRLGEPVEVGQPLARLWVQSVDHSAELAGRLRECFTIADSGESPRLIQDRILP
ncbi:MAG: thymidine phosphorylase [Acidobacteriota bacterium]